MISTCDRGYVSPTSFPSLVVFVCYCRTSLNSMQGCCGEVWLLKAPFPPIEALGVEVEMLILVLSVQVDYLKSMYL